MNAQSQIQRYSDSDRINHWIVAFCFILAALSGLSMYHPALFWLSSLFGGGAWTRILHPFIGVVMFAAFASMMLRFWHHNRISAADKQWLRQWRDAAGNREEKLPEAGRYNGGQKIIFWVMVICAITLFVTGVLFWRPWFADFLPITLVRLATLLHSAAATVIVVGVIVHVYAAIWVKGSIGAMMKGTVSSNWARKHHLLWYKEITGK